MRYIRTKDGIWELKKYQEEYKYFKVNGSSYKLQKVSECNQADTIEELCDEFIYINREDDIKCFCLLHHPITTIYYGASLEDVETKDLIKNKNIEIYGAIWTEWGLKYVARVNEKGELVLL